VKSATEVCVSASLAPDVVMSDIADHDLVRPRAGGQAKCTNDYLGQEKTNMQRLCQGHG
jgi:hypothetical protein